MLAVVIALFILGLLLFTYGVTNPHSDLMPFIDATFFMTGSILLGWSTYFTLPGLPEGVVTFSSFLLFLSPLLGSFFFFLVHKFNSRTLPARSHSEKIKKDDLMIFSYKKR